MIKPKNKKIHFTSRILFVFFLIAFSLIGLASCNNRDNSEVSVISFKTTESSYAYKDVLTFEIKFKNNKNHVINTVKINNKNYPVICSDERYDLVYVTDSTLIFVPGGETFKLNGFSYTLSSKEGEQIIEIETSKTCYVNYAVKEDNDIKLINYTVESQSDDKEFYINESVDITVNLDNPDKYPVSKFIFEYLDNEGKCIEQVEKLVFSSDSKNDYSVYSFTMKIFSQSGDYKLHLNSIYYTKGTALVNAKITEEYDAVSNLNLKINKRQVQIMDLSFNELSDKKIYTDLNNKTYIDSNAEISLVAKIKNESNLQVKGLVINGTTYNINKDMIQTNTMTNIQTIKFNVKVSSKAEEGNINTCSFVLTKVRLQDNQTTEFSVPVEAELKIYVYDKIIKDASDLDKMTINEETKTITGNYILANDITISKNLHGKLLSDYSFNGFLEGNGKTIKFASDLSLNEKPLFETIGETGVIKNVKFTQAIFKNSNMFANINNGIIKNVETITNTIHKPSNAQTETIRGGLVGINNGTISDINLKGGLEIQQPYNIDARYHFSMVAYQNNGNIFRIVNNIVDITAHESLNNSFVYLTCYENNGTIAQVVYLLNNISVDNFKPLILVTDSYKSSEDAVFANIYLNYEFIEKVAKKKNFDLSTPDSFLSVLGNLFDLVNETAFKALTGQLKEDEYCPWLTFNQEKCELNYATPEDLGLKNPTSGKALVFYSRLGFGSGGTDEFWSYNMSSPKFDFTINK